MHTTSRAVALALLASSAAATYQWPSLPYDALEEFIYEGTRPDGSSLTSLVKSCKLRGGTNTTVAAEWVRLVYHDTATHDISDGSGGLDGSIFFETDRDENVGTGMTNTLSDFSVFPSKYISRADIIAIGTIFAVASCGGPAISIRGGRVDANVAGPYGVPNVTDSTESLTATFARQGFNVTEMIQLVACGHTLGTVRSADFPTIVAPGPNNETEFDLFDTTQNFDNNIVTEYLAGTTQDPLVVGNSTSVSDLRVFSADNNATMQAMSSASAFSSTCVTIFDKMLNNVPTSVTLTDYIDLVPVKVGNTQLTLSTDNLEFQTSARLSVPSSGTTMVTLFWCDRYGSGANCAGNLQRYTAPAGKTTVSSPISSTMGLTLQKYQFVVPIDQSASIAKFWFEVDYGNGTTTTANNNGAYYTITQDQVLWVPSLSIAKPVTGSGGWTIVAAVKSGSSPSRVSIDCFGRATTNYIAVNATYDLALNSSLSSRLGYDFYSVLTTADFGATMQFDLSTVAGGQTYTDTYRQAGLLSAALPDATVANSTTNGKVGGDSAAWSWRTPSVGLLAALLSVAVVCL